MIDIDFAGGVEINANTPKYNIKAICEYCKENNIDILHYLKNPFPL